MTQNKKKILGTPLAIALSVLVIGSIISILHWPFSFELRLTSFITIGLLYAIRFGLKQSKNIKDLAKVIMVLSWAILWIFLIFKMNNLIYFHIILGVSGCTWLILEVWDINEKKPKSERANFPQLIGMLISIAYYIFKIQHWPFAGPMLMLYLTALILLAIGFIIDSKELNKISS